MKDKWKNDKIHHNKGKSSLYFLHIIILLLYHLKAQKISFKLYLKYFQILCIETTKEWLSKVWFFQQLKKSEW